MDKATFERRAGQLAAKQCGVLAISQLTELGATRQMIRSRVQANRWELIAAGVLRIVGSSDTWEQKAWAAHLEAGLDAVLSHGAAARLHGLHGYADAVTLVTTRPRHRHRGLLLSRAFESSHLPRSHLTSVSGLPCTTVARCIFDLAGDPPIWARRRPRPLEVHAQKIAQVINHALAHRLVAIDELASVLAAHGRRGRAGTALMRRLVREFAPGYVPTESELEAIFLALVKAEGLPEPERQVRLGDGSSVIGRVDFLFREAKLIVEVDGALWHDGPLDRDRDVARDLRLCAQGYQVIRVRWQQLVFEPEVVIAALVSMLCQRPVA